MKMGLQVTVRNRVIGFFGNHLIGFIRLKIFSQGWNLIVNRLHKVSVIFRIRLLVRCKVTHFINFIINTKIICYNHQMRPKMEEKSLVELLKLKSSSKLVISSWWYLAVKGCCLHFLFIDFFVTTTCATSFLCWHRRLAACWVFSMPEWAACDSRCVSFNARLIPFPESHTD
jgi:hypothetical protein